MTITCSVPAGYRLVVKFQSDGTVVVTIEPIGFGKAMAARLGRVIRPPFTVTV
jgi:hypothetical protein